MILTISRKFQHSMRGIKPLLHITKYDEYKNKSMKITVHLETINYFLPNIKTLSLHDDIKDLVNLVSSLSLIFRSI